MLSHQPTTHNWVIIHIVIPLLPFLFESIFDICIILTSDITMLNWGTFKAANLAMSSGLLCLFVNQSLLSNDLLLPDEYEKEKMRGSALKFIVLAIFCFVFFGALIIVSALFYYKNLTGLDNTTVPFKVIVGFGSIGIIHYAIRTQRSYKLNARI